MRLNLDRIGSKKWDAGFDHVGKEPKIEKFYLFQNLYHWTTQGASKKDTCENRSEIIGVVFALEKF